MARTAGTPGESKTLPRAVKVALGARLNGRNEELPPLTVSLRTAAPQ